MQSRTSNRELGDLPRYNEIHVDHEVSITSSASRSTVSPRRPTYSITPTIYSPSPSASSPSEYSQESHDHESPPTSIERSSGTVSEGTMANLDDMLVSRNASLARRHNGGTPRIATDRVVHRELVDFLRSCSPPPNNLMSAPENLENINQKGSFKLFARKSKRGKGKRVMRLPASAVAATTTHGHKHIAISIQPGQDQPGVVSDYQYHAPVKSPEPQPRTPQKLQKSPPRAVGSAETNSRTVSGSSSAKTGAVTVRKPAVEAATSHAPKRNSSVHINVEPCPSSTEPPTAAQSKSLAARSRTSSNVPPAIGDDDARLLQRFWEQHPSRENINEQSGSNNKRSKMPERAQGSPGRQGSAMTDPRHSGGTAYSERTLATATASGGHSRGSSGNSNLSRQLSGAKIVTIGGHPTRTSSRTTDSKPMPGTPRQFALSSPGSSNATARTTTSQFGTSAEILPARAVIPVETHNGDNDLISLSGFLTSSTSSYTSREPPRPGPAPNRKLPDLPEGSDVSRNGSSSSSNYKARQLTDLSTFPSQTIRSVSKSPSRVAFEKASARKESTYYPDHPANRSTSRSAREVADTVASTQATRQSRQERVRAKKQRDIAHLKRLDVVQARPEKACAGDGLDTRSAEGSQPRTISSVPTGSSSQGSVRNARKRTEGLLPAPLDLAKIPTYAPSSTTAGNGNVSHTSLPVRPHTATGAGHSLPASSYGSGSGKGSVRHARKRSESLMSPLAKVEASSTDASMLQNPSLRAAANALSSIMQEAGSKPQGSKKASHLTLVNAGQGSRLKNGFPSPPHSSKKQSPRGSKYNQGGSAHGTQTPPRSPSPSLQSSDEEGSLNDGGTTGVAIPFRSLSGSQSKSSTKPTGHSSKVKLASVGIPIIALQQKSSLSHGHSRKDSANSMSQASPSHHHSDSMNTIHARSNSESLRAAINVFEIHRANRRQERNRILRDRRAREIAYHKERTAQDEVVSDRLAKGEERDEAIGERLKRIEDRSVDMARKYELLTKMASDLEDMKSLVGSLNDKVIAASDTSKVQRQSQASSQGSARDSELMSPLVGKMGTRGMRIDISMPPSTCGGSAIDPTPASLTASSGLGHGRRLPFAESDLDISGSAKAAEDDEDEDDKPPQYEGHGVSNSLGGGISGRSLTPIGSLIDELSVQSSSSSMKGNVGRYGGLQHYVRSRPRPSPKRKGRGSRDGDVVYEGMYDASVWSGEDSGIAVEAEKALAVSDMD